MPSLIYSNLSSRSSMPAPPVRPPKERHFKVWVILLAVILVGVVFFKINSSVKAADRAHVLAVEAHQKQADEKFSVSMGRLVSDNPAISLSVSTIDLNSGASQHFGQSGPMVAASVGKLLSAALYLHDTETGQASLNNQIGGYSAKYQLQQLVQQSDDTAWELFNNYLGHSALLVYAQSNGLSSYNPADNTLSTNDIARLLKNLYQGHLLNPAHTKLLLSYMQNTNYENFISPAVPSGDKIYHKVGLVNDNVNDAAIITNGRQSFILVIFTDGHGTQDWGGRAELMQQITTQALKAYIN